MKTLIAIPCMDTIPVRFAQSLLYMHKGDVSVCFKPNSLIYDSRNQLSLTAIEQNFDRVLWIDSDMTFSPDAYHTLAHSMEITPDCEMISAVYVKRKIPTLPVIYDELSEPTFSDGIPVRHIHEYADYPRNSIFPVKGCGFGFVLTSTKLLKQVWDNFGPAFHPFPWCGEDLAFCHRVNLLGHTIYCDSNVLCGHVGQYEYTDNLLKRGDE